MCHTVAEPNQSRKLGKFSFRLKPVFNNQSFLLQTSTFSTCDALIYSVCMHVGVSVLDANRRGDECGPKTKFYRG